MRRLPATLTALALALGAVHLALAATSWSNWNLETLWFAGSGLSILTAGLLNLLMIRLEQADHVQRTGWLLANLLMTGFFGLAWLVLPTPQVIIGGLVFGLLSTSVAARAFVRA